MLKHINPKISIIIPCYNSENYIQECLNSIKKQDFLDFEVIIINDGSTDNSKKIIEDNILGDERFILINQKNRGVSATRNIGIKEAKAEYLCFIDIDDYISSNYLSELYSCTIKNKNNILVQVLNINIFSKDRIRNIFLDYTIKNNKSFNNILKDNFLSIYVWGKLYKKSIILDNNILFSNELSIGEDLYFNIKYLSSTKGNIIFSLNNIYYYRELNNSLSRNITQKSILARHLSGIKIYKFLKKHNMLEKDNLKLFYMGFAYAGNVRFVVNSKKIIFLLRALSVLDKSKIKFSLIHRLKCNIKMKIILYILYPFVIFGGK